MCGPVCVRFPVLIWTTLRLTSWWLRWYVPAKVVLTCLPVTKTKCQWTKTKSCVDLDALVLLCFCVLIFFHSLAVDPLGCLVTPQDKNKTEAFARILQCRILRTNFPSHRLHFDLITWNSSKFLSKLVTCDLFCCQSWVQTSFHLYETQYKIPINTREKKLNVSLSSFLRNWICSFLLLNETKNLVYIYERQLKYRACVCVCVCKYIYIYIYAYAHAERPNQYP